MGRRPIVMFLALVVIASPLFPSIAWAATIDCSESQCFGTEESDEINGTAGSEVIYAGAVDDILYGEQGADKFNCGAGKDTIKDYNPSQGDTIIAGCEVF